MNIESLRTLTITGDTEPDHGSFAIENPYASGIVAGNSRPSSTFSSNDNGDDDDNSTVGGASGSKTEGLGDWYELQPKDGVTAETNRNRNHSSRGGGISFTAYDQKGVAHTRTVSGAPSVASGASSRTGWEAWNISPSTRGPETAAVIQQKHQPEQRTKGRNPGFAKVPVSCRRPLTLSFFLLEFPRNK